MLRFTKYILALICLSIHLLSCQTNGKKKEEPLISNLAPKLEINTWQDSIYIQRTQSLEIHEGNLLIADFTGSRILKLDPSYQITQKIGTKGRGPEETFGAMFVNVQHDIYYLLDRGNKRINTFFEDGTHRKVIKFEESISVLGKFAVDASGNIYISTQSDQHLYTKFDENGRVILPFGTPSSNLPAYLPAYVEMSHLLMLGDDKLLAVNISQPIIDVYDLEGNLLEHYDLTSNPLFANIQEAIKTKYQAHEGPAYMYVALVRDAIVWQNYLFTLCGDAPLGGQYKETYSNKVYVFDIEDNMQVVEIINLTVNPSEESDGKGFGAIGIFPKSQSELLGFDWHAQTLYVYDWESPLVGN